MINVVLWSPLRQGGLKSEISNVKTPIPNPHSQAQTFFNGITFFHDPGYKMINIALWSPLRQGGPQSNIGNRNTPVLHYSISLTRNLLLITPLLHYSNTGLFQSTNNLKKLQRAECHLANPGILRVSTEL
jgi:hypothetical protein